MKKIVNNRIFKFVLITIILLAIFSTIYYIDLSRFKSKLVKYDDKYLMKITYLIADRDKLDDNASFDSTTNTDDIDYVLYNASQEVPMIKKGDYLYVDLSNFTNKLLLSHVTDTVFAMNNLNGEVIDGCSYDKDTKTIKVPYSYYKEIDKNNPVIVQAGIEILLTREEIRNIEISYSVKKLITHQEKTHNDLMTFQTEIPLSKYVNSNLSKDNLHIYVNNSKAELDEKSFNYDNKTEVLSISMPSILINNVDIRIGNNIIKNVFAVSSSDIPLANSYKLKEKPTRLIDDWNNGEGWYTTPGYSYDDGLASDELFYCGDNTTNINFQGRPLCWNYTDGGRSANVNTFSYDRSYYYDYNEGTYYKANTNRIYPYMVHADMLARQWSWGEGDENVWLKFDDPNSYIILECIHPGERAIGGSSVYSEEPIFVRLRVSVDVDSDLSQNFLILKVVTYAYNKYRDDYTIGGWGTQAGVAFIKVYWEDNQKCDLDIKKQVSTTLTNTGTATATIALYPSSNCTGTATTKTVSVGLNNGNNGTVTFEDLTPNTTYSYMETSFPNSVGFTTSSTCQTVTPTGPDANGKCNEKPTITNTQSTYCYYVKKVDAESSSTNISGAQWTMTGADGQVYTATTGTNGVATFTGLKYQNYTLKETSVPTGYFNDNSTGVSISASSLTAGSSNCNGVTKTDTKIYYCLKVKKVDAVTGETLTGATFTAAKGSTSVSSANTSTSDGITSFFIGGASNSGNYTVTESVAPTGFAKVSTSKTLAAVAMAEYANESAARTACFTNSGTGAGKASDGTLLTAKMFPNNNSDYVFKDNKYFINWYKTVENGTTLVDGAEFKVKSGNNYITVSNPVSVTDASGNTRSCYVYTGTNNTGSTMVAGAGGRTGEVCITKIPNGTYTVEETKAPSYHTFGSSKTLSISTSTSIQGMSNSNKLVNYKSEFEFTKTVSSGDSIDFSSTTTNELKKLSFNIMSGNTVLSFIKVSDGVYEYAGNTIDKPSGTAVTDLKLDDNRKFKVYHLPEGTYSVKEKKECCDGSCNSCSGTTPCSGYYYPNYSAASSYQFTINSCSSPNATSCGTSGAMVKKTLNNTPTSITFTKKDLYSYATGTSSVKFENEDEVNAFDKITFKIKEKGTNTYLKVIKVADGEYRYVSDISLLTPGQQGQLTENIYTKNGTVKITHLCRGKSYTLEETAVPSNTVFTLSSTHPTKDYVLPFTENGQNCCTDNTVATNTTAEISDVPTRIALYKKNNRPFEDIHEGTTKKETATFEVYACSSSVANCTYNNSSKHAIKFANPVVQDGETVYRALLNQNGTGTTSLHLTTEGNYGKLVLEYLPANYKYVVVEKNAPDGYYNVEGSLAETEIASIPVNTTNASANIKNINNYPTMLKFKKSDIYKYYSATDKAKLSSNDQIFDTMTFVLRDKDGHIVSLTKVADGEYRFIQNNGTITGNNVTELHTKNGELIITHLYRNENYYIEETKRDTEGNFILPKNVAKPSGIPSGWDWKGHPFVTYHFNDKLPTDTRDGIVPSDSVTSLIENLPTRVVFEKRDTMTGDLIDDTKLSSSSHVDRKTTFNVYRCPKTVEHCRADSTGAELVNFEQRSYINNFTSDITAVSQPIYAYKYSKLNNTGVTDLITDRGVLVLAYLPSEYSYSLYEKIAPNGYYEPGNLEKYTDFTVLDTTTDSGNQYVELTSRIGNKPTEIKFSKTDLYGYIDVTDKVKFESNNKINAYDDITFRLKNESGDYLQLLKVSDHGNCQTDDSYAEYKFYTDTSVLTQEEQSRLTTDLHTCGGHIRITYLHRGDKYKLEEYSIPQDSIFILTTEHTTVDYQLPNVSDSNSLVNGNSPVTNQTMNNTPTRIILSKKNNRVTNEDIHEGTNKKETAEFEVYACDKSKPKCTYAESTGVAIKFSNPTVHGTETVYSALPDQTKSGITTLNLITTNNKGKLVLEYLPANYKYVVVEKNAPDGYYDVSGALAETEIDHIPMTTTNGAANNKNINNYPTMIKFRKSDIYKYYSASDKDKLNSNDQIFDTMTFVLRDKDGHIVSLTKEADGEYRFIQADGTYSANTVTELHTKDGEMLITNLYRGEKYYIEETITDTEGNFVLPKNISKPSGIPSGWVWKGHPFVSYSIANDLPTDSNYGTTVPESLTQLIENLPTRVVFEKRDKTTNELINDPTTTFNVYRCPKTVEHCRADSTGAELVHFENRTYITGFTDDITSVTPPVYAYKYTKLNDNSGITDLITDRGMLVLAYLPSNYSYSLYEKTAPNGYYQPSTIEAYTDFEVLSDTLEDNDYVELTSKIVNTPTEIYFIKSDLYDYYEDEDLASLRDERIKIFDSMSFIIRDASGTILNLKCTSDGEVVTRKNTDNKCDTGEYRYIPVNVDNAITYMHTNKGKLKVTHLNRGQVYYIEEVFSDTEGNFTLPNYLDKDLNYGEVLPFDNQGHPVVKYILPETDENNPLSVTAEIDNTPTRVVFEKRDSKYNYLIPDETVTFRVYQCDINTDCHPADYNTDEEREAAGIRIVNFERRDTIRNDQEDSGTEVYKYKKLNANGIQDLHPDHGKLVLRYLPSDSNYKYVLLETIAPINYLLPKGREAEIEFTVVSTSVDVEQITVPNKPTAIVVRKYSDSGELLGGAKFKVYKVNNYNENKSVKDQDKELVKLKTIKDGIYEHRPTLDTDVITTCSGDSCSYDPSTLGYTVDEFNSIDDLINTSDSNVKTVLKEGTALIQYLEYDTYYIIEEVQAPKGYSLPENEDGRYTLIRIKHNETEILDTQDALVNKPTSFTFYKFDEYNTPLDGAKFYLQKLDDSKKYVTLTLSKEVLENGTTIYKADPDSELTNIETVNGQATVYYLEPGQYRILEVEAPEGKELPKKTINVATFFVDEDGSVFGNNIITNKKPQETIEYLAVAKAEVVVVTQTGKKVVRYGLIITGILGLIAILILFMKKRK